MKAAIRFIEPDNKLAILTKLLEIIQGIEKLRQHALTHGFLLENLNRSEVEALKGALTKVGYSDYTATKNSLRLMIAHGEPGSLVPLLITIPGFGNDFAEMFWERGFSIEKLTANEADDLKQRLGTIATVTITPDIADIPQAIVYTVSGQVRHHQDNSPFTESGFTVHAFDSISLNNLVPLGSSIPNPKGNFWISYMWQGEGRKGPNLVLRLSNSKGDVIAEVLHSLASANEILNITVKEPQTQSFILAATVKNPATGEVLPNVQVEAEFLKSNGVLQTGLGTTNSDGVALIPFGESVFNNNPDGQIIQVAFRVHKGNEPLNTSTIISNLQPRNQEVDVLVTLPQVVSPEPSRETFIVTGTVRQADETPLRDVAVHAFDRDMRTEELLGQTVTNAEGFYEIRYSKEQFRRKEKERADLLVRVFSPVGEEIAVSHTVFNAQEQQTIDLRIELEKFRGASEYERYLGEIKPLAEGVPVEQLTDEDLGFLNGETNIPYEHLDRLRLDTRWSLQHKLIPGVFYGLLRQGLSTNLRGLLAEKSSRFRNLLQKSLDKNVIPAAIGGKIDHIIDQLISLATSLAFEPEKDPKQPAPIGAILQTAQLEPEVQRKAVEFIFRHEGEEDLWDALASNTGIGPSPLNTIRFTLESGKIVFDHLPMLEALQTFRKEQSWNSARDLARLKRADWKQVTQKTAVQALPEGFENADEFAEAVAFRVEQIFPTTVVAHRLAEDTKLGNKDINYFFAANPDFDLLHTALEDYLKKQANLGQVSDQPQLTIQLKTLQRVARVTPDERRFDLMQGLLYKGYDSALKIAESDKEEFLAYMTPIAGEKLGEAVWENAKFRLDASNVYALSLIDYTHGIFSLPRLAPTGELPTWAKLFGTLSSCACKHCRSVYSPAAYLVDLLQFLRKAPNVGGQLLSELLKRRPELEHILLNCDNANTPLPYIDLVNEILELQVSPPSPWRFYQTAGSSELEKAALRAQPQNQYEPAYQTLAGAVHPWVLPFNLGHEETKLFTLVADIQLFDLFELFNLPRDKVARTHLGMAEETWNKIASPADSDETLKSIWGNPGGTSGTSDLALLDKVPEILTRASLSYEELESLVNSRLFASFKLKPETFKLSINRGADPCKFEYHLLQKYKPDGKEYRPLEPVERLVVFDLIHRFVRLQHALGWSIERLSDVLVERGFTPAVGDEAERRKIDLVELSRLTRLADRVRLPVENTAKLKDAKQLARALGRPEAEIRYLIELSGSDPFPAGPDNPSNLEQLEALLDHYDVLKTAGLDVAELRYLLRHRDLTPAVFEPTVATLHALLQNLYDAMRRSDTEFPAAGFDLVGDTVQMAVDCAIKLYDKLLAKLSDQARKTSIEEFKQNITADLQNKLEAAKTKIESGHGARIVVETVAPEFQRLVIASYEAAAAVNPELDPLAPDVLAFAVASFLEQFKMSFSGLHDKWQKLIQAALENLAAVVGTSIEHLKLLVLPKWNGDGSIGENSILHALSGGEPTTTPMPAIESFLALIRRRNDQPLPVLVFEALPDTDPRKVSAEQMFLRLTKAARLIQILHIAPEELEIINRRRDTASFLDFNTLPVQTDLSPASFDRVLTLARAKIIQAELPQADKTLFDLLELAHNREVTIESFLSTVANQTGWNRNPRTGEEYSSSKPLDVLQAELGLTMEKFQQPETYALLKTAVDFINQRQIKADFFSKLLSSSDEELREVLATVVEARYPNEVDRYKALTPAQDTLRERKRDALVAYLVNKPGSIWKDANSLYAYFLIDVEMSSCQLTSRIVQANSAIQLFVQRCLMNLEPGIPLGQTSESAHWKQWTWMKNYRVWEANRKVFLYPENWIEPDLRDGKSPFFEELENQLLQDEVNQESVERAYESYFVKLDDVAHLDVRAMYQEGQRWSPKTLYVIARTRNEPHIYFYRKRFSDQAWSAWEKIDLSIEGDHVFAIVHNGRLMLFWAIFSESETDWNLNLKWSLYRSGSWEAPRTGIGPQIAKFSGMRFSERQAISSLSFTPSDFYFRAEHDPATDDLNLLLFLAREWGSSLVSRTAATEHWEWTKVQSNQAYSIAVFKFDTCRQQLKLDPNKEKVTFSLRPNQAFFQVLGMGFRADWSGPTPLEVGTKAVGSQEIDIPQISPQPWYDNVLFPLEYWHIHFGIKRNRSRRVGWSSNIKLLGNFGDGYELVGTVDDINFNVHHPFVVDGSERSYLVSEGFESLRGEKLFSRNSLADMEYKKAYEIPKYRFESFYHPFFCRMVNEFSKKGIDGVLKVPNTISPLHRQLYKEPKLVQCSDRLTTKFRCYEPTELVWKDINDPYDPYPYEQFEFSNDGSYSLYNWEIFFHIPLLIADRLSKNQQFEEAQRWFHYIFDPTDVSTYTAPTKYWQVKPLFELAQQWEGYPETLEDMLRRLAIHNAELEYQVEQWRNNPFNPHLIARLRLVAYMKTVVQKYLDNLIVWGDHLFQQETMESINEATQLYILAAEILGQRPVTISREETKAHSYSTIRNSLDGFSNLLVEIDSSLPPQALPLPDSILKEIPPNLVLYFCLPFNEKLASYWDTVSDRLFKVRHCMNIEGQVRQLPLFAPPIDPGLLVRARAMGLDLQTVLEGALATHQANYRYQYLSQKAQELCSEVRSLAGALLTALEKKDTEDLSLMRSRQELSMLKLVRAVKDKQIEEAKETLEGLRESRKLADKRKEFYLSREFMSAAEKSHTDNLHVAHGFEITSSAFNLAASIAHLAPDVSAGTNGVNVTYGGSSVGKSLDAAGHQFALIASQYSFDAMMASTMAGHERRRDDWRFQAELAQKELDQIDKQILAAEIRLNIAELDRTNHERQIEQSEETDAFLKSKFTNSQLYSWMIAQISALNYQSYRLAYDMAKKAEQALKQELGLESISFIQFGHWDSMKKGLLAGERLALDLKRMEAAYLDQNKREYELTKHISLRQLDPLALLLLKTVGKCEVIIPEWLFDLETAGHYMRRIKNVTLSIPAVTGPYTSVNCTLSLLKSTIRKSALLRNGQYAREMTEEDSRFADYYGSIQSIVTSTAQNDSGMFETNMRDERYLPFEGSGIESSWTLELPSDFRQFDYNSISDVILHVRYTARPGGEALRRAAMEYLKELIRKKETSGLIRIFSLKRDFPSEWHRFVSGNEAFQATLKKEYFPYFVQAKKITFESINLHAIKEGKLQEVRELNDVQPDALQRQAEFTLSTLLLDDSLKHNDAEAFLSFHYTVE